jgi:formate hydrogenlyase subunit 4
MDSTIIIEKVSLLLQFCANNVDGLGRASRSCWTKQSWSFQLFQPLADGLKLFSKEEFEPTQTIFFFVVQQLP